MGLLALLKDEGDLTWDHAGVDAAVKELLRERNTRFDSLVGKLESYPRLKETLLSMPMEGEPIPFLPDQEEISQLVLYGFARKGPRNNAQIDNRIFETRLYELFLMYQKPITNGSRHPISTTSASMWDAC